MKIIAIIALLSLAACADTPTAPTETDIATIVDAQLAHAFAQHHGRTPQEIATIAKRATVYLVIKTSTGTFDSSGFLVDNGHIVTCAHNLKGMIAGTVSSVLTGQTYPIHSIVKIDKIHDLALVQATGLAAYPLALGDSDNVRDGDSIYVHGNPEGHIGTFATGIVSAIRPNGYSIVNATVFQVTTPTALGASGSPILNQHAEVIGIQYAWNPKSQNTNFAIPVNALKSLLAR